MIKRWSLSRSLVAGAGEHLDRWQRPGLDYKIEFSKAAFPLFISTVSPNKAPLQAIYGALCLGKLIMGAQARCSPIESFGQELLRHTQSIREWQGSSPEQCPASPLLVPHTQSILRNYSGHNCIRVLTSHSKNSIPSGVICWQAAEHRPYCCSYLCV